MRILTPAICLCLGIISGFACGLFAADHPPVSHGYAQSTSVQVLEARERNLALQQQLLDQRSHELDEDRRRFEDGKRAVRAYLLDAVPRLISYMERYDVHGDYQNTIQELRVELARLQERQNATPPY